MRIFHNFVKTVFMILAVDIGNSTVSFGIYVSGCWKHTWKLETVRHESIFYYQQKFVERLVEENIESQHFEQVIISSVVPGLTLAFSDFFKGLDHAEVILLNKNIYHHLPVYTENPYELGTDLMANALAAYQRHKAAVLIIDFGTALTFTMVENDGKISGVNIAPGLMTAIKSLSANTAQLLEVDLQRPPNILGTNTIEAIQNGIIIGYEGLVSHMIREIRMSKDHPVIAIATGGLANILPPDYFDEIDQNLTLDGLRIAGSFVAKGK